MNKQRANLVLLEIVTLLVILLYFNLFTVQPEGYHIDVYSQIGKSFWIIWGLALILIVRVLLNDFYSLPKIVRIITGIILVEIFVAPVLIPSALSYYLSDRMDSIYYLGISTSTYQHGHVPRDVYPYPLYPILISIFKVILERIPINILATYLSNALGILFVIILFVFLRGLLGSGVKEKVPLLLFSFPYYLGHYYNSLAPNYYAFLLFTLFIVLFYKMNSVSSIQQIGLNYYLILNILTIAIPFAHPYVSYALIMFLGLVIVFNFSFNHKQIQRQSFLLYLFSTLIVTTIFWILLISRTGQVTVKSIIFGLLTGHLVPTIEKVSGDISKARILYLHEIIFWIILTQGKFIVLSIISMFTLVKYYRIVVRSYLKALYTAILFIIVESTFLFAPYLSHHLDRVLSLNYALFGLLIVTALYWKLSAVCKNKDKKMLWGALTVIMIISSVSYLYYSPINFQSYTGIAKNEITGMSFLNAHYGSEFAISSPGDQLRWRFCQMFYINNLEKCSATKLKTWRDPIDDSLQYSNVPFPLYVIISDFYVDTYLHLAPYRRTGKLSKNKIAYFASVFPKIYNSLNIKIYLINPRGEIS